MAEALARHLAADVIEPFSAGISPYGTIIEPTRKVLLERSIRLDSQFSKGLSEASPELAEIVVNMTGLAGLKLPGAARLLNWDVTDPYGGDLGLYRQILAEIEEKILALAASLREP